MNHDEIIEKAAKFLWECDQEGTTDEWREMAWNDMGGSEPTDERQIYEIRARALADAGLLARPLPSYDEIVDACRNGMNAGGPFPWPAADGVLALLKGQEA